MFSAAAGNRLVKDGCRSRTSVAAKDIKTRVWGTNKKDDKKALKDWERKRPRCAEWHPFLLNRKA